MVANTEVLAGALGFTKGHRTTLDLIDEIVKGLPVKALYRISSEVAPGDASFKFRIVPKATLARRNECPGARLTSEESDRLARLANVWGFAKEVWGSDGDARAFLFRLHPLLGNRPPIDLVLATDLGAQMVTEILGRLKYGSAA